MTWPWPRAALCECYLSARTLASQSGAITLLASHRFSTVRMADLIIVLDQGRIAATGDHASLIRAGGLYAELHELQARAYPLCSPRSAAPGPVTGDRGRLGPGAARTTR